MYVCLLSSCYLLGTRGEQKHWPRQRPLQLEAGHTVDAERLDVRMGSKVGVTAGQGYKRQRFSNIEAKQGEHEWESRGCQHFELVACRQLLMLAYMAWGGRGEVARDTEMEGSPRTQPGDQQPIKLSCTSVGGSRSPPRQLENRNVYPHGHVNINATTELLTTTKKKKPVNVMAHTFNSSTHGKGRWISVSSRLPSKSQNSQEPS